MAKLNIYKVEQIKTHLTQSSKIFLKLLEELKIANPKHFFFTFLFPDDEITDLRMFQAVRLQELVLVVLVIFTISSYYFSTS